MIKQDEISAATSALSTLEKPYLRGISLQLGSITSALEKINTTLNKGDSLGSQLVEALKNPDNWIAWGQVSDAHGIIPDLRVKLSDKDCLDGDDPLGHTLTNSEGQFLLVYETSDFQKGYFSQLEDKPDLYLTIMDVTGNILYRGDHAVRCDAGTFERFYVNLGTDDASR